MRVAALLREPRSTLRRRDITADAVDVSGRGVSNAAGPKLFEGVAELASASDGNDVAVLAFGDGKPKENAQFGGVALPLSEDVVARMSPLPFLTVTGVSWPMSEYPSAPSQMPRQRRWRPARAVHEDESP